VFKKAGSPGIKQPFKGIFPEGVSRGLTGERLAGGRNSLHHEQMERCDKIEKKRMSLIRIFIQNMIGVLNRSSGRVEQREVYLPSSLSECFAGFHDIKKGRWNLPPGFYLLFRPSRLKSSPVFSLFCPCALPSLI
jgi:hypothetical protein